MIDLLMSISMFEALAAVIATVLCYLQIVRKKDEKAGKDVYFQWASACRNWSMVLVPVAWCIALCGSHEEYLAACQKLGMHCGMLSEGWLLAVIVGLILNLALAWRPREKKEMELLWKLNRRFVVGTVVLGIVEVLLTGA